MSDSLRSHEHQTSLSFMISWVCPNSCPLSWWFHPTISSSLVPFPSFLPSASGSFPTGQLLESGGQSIGTSGSTSFLPMNSQGWFPLGLTSLISLFSKGLSRVFCSTPIGMHQFFGAQPSLWFNSHIVHDYWKKHSFDYTLLAKWCLWFLIYCQDLS